MEIKEVKLRHFRNYQGLDIDFAQGVNIFIGENAQGKTNLMEAIHVLALARSHRTSKDRDMIAHDQESAYISGLVETAYTSLPLEITLSKQGKSAKVNHLLQSSLTSYVGHLKVVLFAPEDLALVKGAPGLRRRFIDMELGQMSPVYLHQLSQYQRVLKQRNHQLKKLKYQAEAQDLLFLEVLTEQLTELAADLISRRVSFIDRLQAHAQVIHSGISQGKEVLTLAYESSVQADQFEDMTLLQDQISQHFQSIQDREIDQATTLIGPHRDDLNLFINQKKLKDFGSQGQQRTTVLSLKLAEIDLMKEETGDYPVLLLDDVLSELDDNRQTQLLATIEDKVQTFLTTTSIDGLRLEDIHQPELYWIKDGKIERETI